jgi:MFS family permease
VHKPIFHGWYVVAGAFAVTFFGFGSAYTFSAFIEPMQQAFGASRGQVSTVFSFAGFLYFALGVVSGPLADRWGARRVAFAGMAIVAAGLVAASFATSLVQVLAGYGLGIGVGVGLAYVPAVGAVPRWFVRHRGLAAGLAVSGIGLGTLLMPPLAAALIQALGWRHAYLVLGVAALVLGGGMSLLLENNPQQRGLLPDGDVRAAGAAAPQAATGATLAQAVRSRQFLFFYAAAVAASFGVFVPFVHLVPYARDHGIAPGTAVLLLGGIGIGSTVGRFIVGGVADRLGRRLSLVLTYAAMAAMLLMWAASTSLVALAVFSLCFGTFYGGWVALMPSLAMDCFGGKRLSSILGALYTSVAFGTLLGPTVAGFAYDLSGSYVLTIVVAGALNVVAAAITWWMPPQPLA